METQTEDEPGKTKAGTVSHKRAGIAGIPSANRKILTEKQQEVRVLSRFGGATALPHLRFFLPFFCFFFRYTGAKFHITAKKTGHRDFRYTGKKKKDKNMHFHDTVSRDKNAVFYDTGEKAAEKTPIFMTRVQKRTEFFAIWLLGKNGKQPKTFLPRIR